MFRNKARPVDYSDFPLSVRLQKRRDERRAAIGAVVWGSVQAALFTPLLIASFAHVVALIFFGALVGMGVALVLYGIRDARIARRNEESEKLAS